MSRKKRRKGQGNSHRADNAAGQLKEVPEQPQVINPQPLGPKTREQTQSVKRTLMQYQGPIPPPALLYEYSDAVENGAERVLQLVERESAHIQSQERIALAAQVSIVKRGQIFAFVIAVASLGGAVFVVPASVALASGFLVSGVGTLAVAFLNMLRSQTPPGKSVKK